MKDLRKKILIKNESKTLARYPGRCVSDMPYANEDHQGKWIIIFDEFKHWMKKNKRRKRAEGDFIKEELWLTKINRRGLETCESLSE